jgi:hypothetical protein
MMTDLQLLAAIHTAKKIALPYGSLHPYWDIILDGQAILDGQRSILSRPEVEKMLTGIHEKHR